MKIFVIISLAAISLTAAAMDSTVGTRAIIGEAAGEPFATKLAIASALRNRDSLEGVRGFSNARMIDAQPAHVWADAHRAWAMSATNDIVNGATFFESSNFPTPYWARGIKPVATVGVFRFWKLNPPAKTYLALR
jgi:hypothetical protein